MGRPLTKHTLFILNVLCNSVFAKRLFNTTCGIASFFRSITILIPFLLVSSLMSEMPFILPAAVSSAIFSTTADLLTMKGISVTTIRAFPSSSSSISVFERMTTRPRPVL